MRDFRNAMITSRQTQPSVRSPSFDEFSIPRTVQNIGYIGAMTQFCSKMMFMSFSDHDKVHDMLGFPWLQSRKHLKTSCPTTGFESQRSHVFFPAKILIMADKDEDGEATFQDWEVSTSHGGFTMAKPWLNSRKKWGFPLVFSMEHGSSAEFKCRD